MTAVIKTNRYSMVYCPEFDWVRIEKLGHFPPRVATISQDKECLGSSFLSNANAEIFRLYRRFLQIGVYSSVLITENVFSTNRSTVSFVGIRDASSKEGGPAVKGEVLEAGDQGVPG